MIASLPKWIVSSIYSHLVSELTPAAIPLYLEGEQRTQELENAEVIELRFDGPTIAECPKNRIKAEVEVNALITVQTSHTSNLYRMQQISGLLLDAFNQDIAVYKYGTDVSDDNSFIFCMQLTPLTRTDRALRASNLGNPLAPTKMQQGVVEAHYSGDFYIGG